MATWSFSVSGVVYWFSRSRNAPISRYHYFIIEKPLFRVFSQELVPRSWEAVYFENTCNWTIGAVSDLFNLRPDCRWNEGETELCKDTLKVLERLIFSFWIVLTRLLFNHLSEEMRQIRNYPNRSIINRLLVTFYNTRQKNCFLNCFPKSKTVRHWETGSSGWNSKRWL